MTRTAWIGEFTDEMLDRLPDARIRWRLRGADLDVRVRFGGFEQSRLWPMCVIEGLVAGDVAARHEAWTIARDLISLPDDTDG